jgi:hypothetical protein
MEHHSSLLFSQESAIGPYPGPHESVPQIPPYFSEIHYNIILPSTPRSSEWSLSFGFSYQDFVYISHLSHAC